MVFSSLTFLFVFLPVFLVFYYISPQQYRNGLLFIGSLIFYGVGEPLYLFLILLSVIVNFLIGQRIGKLNSEDTAEQSSSRKKCLLVIALLYNLGLLLFFKYTNFFIENINALSGMNIRLLNIALPLGISFYTFQILSYVIDVYRGDVPAQRNFIDLAMYVAMFPQLIAGPIVRYSDIAGSLKNRKTTLADAFMSFKSMFGFAGIPAVNAASLYYLKSNLVLLIVAAVGATPLPKRIYEKIGGTAGGSRVLAVLTPMAAAAAVAVCTAYLNDGSFNPFVYLRF